MTILPFRPPRGRGTRSEARVQADSLRQTGVDDVAHVPEFDDFGRADFDDLDGPMHRFESFDRSGAIAHRMLTPAVFATLTNVPLTWCQPFHFALFALLEDVGDFDGVIATPRLLIGASDARLDSAEAWLRGHPAPDVEAMIEASENDDFSTVADDEQHIADAVDAHSLAIAIAAGSNPSLTLGCHDAFLQRLTDNFLEIEMSCRVDHMSALTAAAVNTLGSVASTARIVGGVTLRPIETA